MQNAGRRITHSASRITRHELRIPRSALRTSWAFTLIELLVVISVIAILAALTFPAVRAARSSMMRARAKSELFGMQAAIETYKDKLGYYPPDNYVAANPDHYAFNQLYYELLGTTNLTIAGQSYYQTLDGSTQIKATDLPTVFGSGVTGFMNCAHPGRGGDAPNAVSFFPKGLRAGQFMALTNGAVSTPVYVLGTSLDGPPTEVYHDNLGAKLNPWRYNSSNPHYNTKSFDLWIDITLGDKTNRISNWSDRPLIVGAPY
jgi:prepilin-type N-terminal cleavage/methylation domain-containing protein